MNDRPRRCAAAATSGLLFSTGMPGQDLWWIGFFAWLPWLWAIEGRRPVAALGYGLVTGTVFIGIAYGWMVGLLVRFAELPIPAAFAGHLLFSLWHGSVAGAAAMLVALGRRGLGSPAALPWIAALAWVVAEAVVPALFPTYMAVIWASQPSLAQLAELGGPTAVSFAMVLISTALYATVRAAVVERRIAVVPALVGLGAAIALPLHGAWRIRAVDAWLADAPRLRIGVVQGNFGIATYHDEEVQPRILAELQRVTGELEAQGAELAVWGETAYPMTGLARARESDFAEDDDFRIRRGFSIPLVFGASTYTAEDPHRWNSALVLRGDGTLHGRYDKVYPLPFGEAAPSFIDTSWYLQTVPNASHLYRGDGPGRLEAAGWPLGPLICYEDVLTRYVRRAVEQDVAALVNLTNDSWFGRTREQAGHFGLAVFRAIEHRRGLVRAVNAGISGYVDPAGRTLVQTFVTDSDADGFGRAEGFLVDVPMVDPGHRTVYARTGEAFPVACGLVLIALGLVGARRRRRPGPRDPG
jgi:apolipoprotein N-acyltransferase